jgi:mRNA interferase MazF
MNVLRGDVVLAFYPFAPGAGGSRRPVLIVQNDRDNRRMANTIVVQITSNLRRAKEATQLLIEVNTPDGTQSGLLHDSVASCGNIATIRETEIDKVIGRLPDSLMKKLNDCLKAALELP